MSCVLPAWVEPYLREAGPTRSEATRWLRAQRALPVQAIMRRLPPNCVVHLAQEPGAPHFEIGVVSSFFEDGHVMVRPAPAAHRDLWVRVCADKCTPIGFWGGLTPEAVASMLGGESPNN